MDNLTKKNDKENILKINLNPAKKNKNNVIFPIKKTSLQNSERNKNSLQKNTPTTENNSTNINNNNSNISEKYNFKPNQNNSVNIKTNLFEHKNIQKTLKKSKEKNKKIPSAKRNFSNTKKDKTNSKTKNKSSVNNSNLEPKKKTPEIENPPNENIELNISNLEPDFEKMNEDEFITRNDILSIKTLTSNEFARKCLISKTKSFIKFNNNLTARVVAHYTNISTPSYMMALCPELIVKSNKNYKVNDAISEEMESETFTPKHSVTKTFDDKNTKNSTKDKNSRDILKKTDEIENSDEFSISYHDNVKKNNYSNFMNFNNNPAKVSKTTYSVYNNIFSHRKKRNHLLSKKCITVNNNKNINNNEIDKKNKLKDMTIDIQANANKDIINIISPNVINKMNSNFFTSPNRSCISPYINSNSKKKKNDENNKKLIRHQKAKSLVFNMEFNSLNLYGSDSTTKCNFDKTIKMKSISKSKDYRNKILIKEKNKLDTKNNISQKRQSSNNQKYTINPFSPTSQNSNIYMVEKKNNKLQISSEKNSQYEKPLIDSEKSLLIITKKKKNDNKIIKTIKTFHKEKKSPKSINEYQQINNLNNNAYYTISNNSIETNKIKNMNKNATLNKHYSFLKKLDNVITIPLNTQNNLHNSQKMKSSQNNSNNKKFIQIKPCHNKSKTFFTNPAYMKPNSSKPNSINNINNNSTVHKLNKVVISPKPKTLNNKKIVNIKPNNNINTSNNSHNVNISLRSSKKKANNNIKENTNRKKAIIVQKKQINRGKNINREKNINAFHEIRKTVIDSSIIRVIHKKTNTIGSTNIFKNQLLNNNLNTIYNNNLKQNIIIINNNIKQLKKSASINNFHNIINNKRRIMCAMQRIKFIPASNYSKALNELFKSKNSTFMVLVYKDKNQRFIFRGLFEIRGKDHKIAYKIFGINNGNKCLNINCVNSIFSYQSSSGQFMKYIFSDNKNKKFNSETNIILL